MVAKTAASGTSASIDGGPADNSGRRLRALPIAAALFAAVYGGTIAWLLMSDSRFAGEPVIHVALAPEAAVSSAPEDATAGAAPSGNGIAATTPEIPAINPPGPGALSAEERALFEAAQNLDKGVDEDVASEVRIVGAETVSGDEAASENGDIRSAILLPPVPDPALIETSADGPLPKIGRDGRRPSDVYARPVPPGTQADRRIALVVSGMGISESATAHAIEVLPPEVTLSFAPYGSDLQKWIERARDAGHEVLLELPMEPFGYPQNDPGPHTLLTSSGAAENISRLEWLMSRFTGYAGVMNYQGARFTTSPTSLKPVLETIAARGLLYVDNGASVRSIAPSFAREIGLPVAQANRIVDPVQNPEVIATSLDMLKEASQQSGVALGVASGFPVTVDALAQWAVSLEKQGYVLVPATALTRD
ncbi:MAG: divergent polysaccharide deacetylase family protein [Parvibaculum sp.]|uniref:divergent polysaccharide deacetylase family protein n=1 Tax=Parvibaculum sp. TaxID=2024848 RepID=UPI002ABC2BF5|nr:divergent polysaccharide deacetylase family protein [Parvibaculum sp.]MDZ4381278.1 divergent polysaccharide deacetylase family protein [Parvibaculum sp.]